MYNDNVLIIYRIINMEKMCANSIKYQQIRRQQADPYFKLLNYQTPVCRYAPVSVSISVSVSVAPLQTRNHVNNLREEGKVKSTEKEI